MKTFFIIKIPDACIMPICTLHIVVIISVPCGSQSVHDRVWIIQRSYKIPMSLKLWCILSGAIKQVGANKRVRRVGGKVQK